VWVRVLGWSLVVTLALAAPAAAAPGWRAAGPMASNRFFHTATALVDGRVLVAGGFSIATGESSWASAELFSPDTATFAAAPPMAAARYLHTATRLTSGEVLVIGGGSDPAAEVYDPRTNGWRKAGALAANRLYHTATLLPSGRVLVTGGWDTTTHFDSAELYDPATGLFGPTGSIGGRRRAHVAVLLRTGQVLVAGGTDGEALTATELYDPASGRFTALAAGRNRNGGRI
jgi:hypothetical protein